MKGPSSLDRKASADNPQSSRSLEPESSFFLRRRKTNRSSGVDDSEPVSPRFGATPSSRSGASNKSNIDIYPASGNSSLSLGGKFPQNVSDWNERVQREKHTASADPQPRHTVDPPRSPKAGYEWVWFPEGYWAEREAPVSSLNRQKSRRWFAKSQDRLSNSSSPSRGQTRNKSFPNTEIPKIKIGSTESYGGSRGSSHDSLTVEDRSIRSSESESPGCKIKRGLQYVSPTHPRFTSPTGQPEGLYCKVKRNVETSFVTRPQKSTDDPDTASDFGLPSRTTLLLQGTSNYFDRQQHDSKLPTDRALLVPGTPQTQASTDPRPRRGFGLAPWHRKTSHESILSVSSSVHKLLMGRAPAATPALEHKEDDPLNNRIEISEPGQPNFLSSEATRIETPPLSGDSSEEDQPRGFFFDMSALHHAPQEETTSTRSSPSGLSSSASAHPPRRLKKRHSRNSPGDWWDANNPVRKEAAKGLALQKRLEVDMSLPPEHLLSSPLCPKNPMHKSKGSGICVYHGRRRSTSLRSTDGGVRPDYKGLYER